MLRVSRFGFDCETASALGNDLWLRILQLILLSYGQQKLQNQNAAFEPINSELGAKGCCPTYFYTTRLHKNGFN